MIRITSIDIEVTCLVRCIKSYFEKYSEDLATYEKYCVAFMSPLPFGYLGTLSIVKLAKKHPLGMVHVVSHKHVIYMEYNSLESSYLCLL